MFTWVENFIVSVLKEGSIPKHLAFIMDGNRRFAKQRQLSSISGHKQGFHALKETLRVCLSLGVEIVTVYAFSLENFKRPEEEVNGLMKLCHKKLEELNQSGFLKDNQISVRILGELNLLPSFLRDTIDKVTRSTQSHTRAILNVHIAYTSREEILRAMKCVVKKVQDGTISKEEITEEILEDHLYSKDVPDILVRTSGENRLSDYLLWQASSSQLSFLDVLWPDFSFWHICLLVLSFQHQKWK
eukprot:TRINITY_DN6992_c0_g1_i1.p1 TRINITY_DN6992_c0_g1~~TRINITY_DN6992_c0_g1_i1.p1  ORF type:complete len:244 (-),score=70.15 TRINITY_DN6992_c0_g1_i1:246-977(-)